MPAIAIYARVSSRQQDLRSQEPDLNRWAETCADAPVKWYKDKFTGKTMDRPGWKRLEADLIAGKVSRIVVWRLDRLGRTAAGLTALFEDLQRRNIGFESLRDKVDLSTAAGRLMANVLASVAAYENEVRSERILAGQAVARANGKRWGGSQKGRHITVTDGPARTTSSSPCRTARAAPLACPARREGRSQAVRLPQVQERRRALCRLPLEPAHVHHEPGARRRLPAESPDTGPALRHPTHDGRLHAPWPARPDGGHRVPAAPAGASAIGQVERQRAGRRQRSNAEGCQWPGARQGATRCPVGPVARGREGETAGQGGPRLRSDGRPERVARFCPAGLQGRSGMANAQVHLPSKIGADSPVFSRAITSRRATQTSFSVVGRFASGHSQRCTFGALKTCNTGSSSVAAHRIWTSLIAPSRPTKAGNSIAGTE